MIMEKKNHNHNYVCLLVGGGGVLIMSMNCMFYEPATTEQSFLLYSKCPFILHGRCTAYLYMFLPLMFPY